MIQPPYSSCRRRSLLRAKAVVRPLLEKRGFTIKFAVFGFGGLTYTGAAQEKTFGPKVMSCYLDLSRCRL